MEERPSLKGRSFCVFPQREGIVMDNCCTPKDKDACTIVYQNYGCCCRGNGNGSGGVNASERGDRLR